MHMEINRYLNMRDGLFDGAIATDRDGLTIQVPSRQELPNIYAWKLQLDLSDFGKSRLKNDWGD